MTKMPEKLRRTHRYKIAVCISFIMLISVSNVIAAPNAKNFLLDEKGNVVQLSTISLGKKMALNKAFPLEDSNRGLLLTDFETGKTIAKFKPKKNKNIALVTNVYALDTKGRRINCPHFVVLLPTLGLVAVMAAGREKYIAVL